MQKLKDLKDVNIIIIKKCTILDVVYMQRGVLFVISERVVNATSVENISRKEMQHLYAKSLQRASEYRTNLREIKQV